MEETKMKKKWILPIVVLSLLVVGVSAVLVDYLSNPVSGTVNVESPLVLTGGFTVNAIDAFSLIEKDFTLENRASTTIEAIVEIVVVGNKAPESNFNNPTIGEEFEVFKIGMLL